MGEVLSALFSAEGFMPHGHCYLWRPGVVWLHVISDALITIAYASIPFTLVYFVRKRRDVPFNWMFICFGVFIIACGATHAMEIWTLWTPTYWLAGIVKAITAAASVPTAVLLIRLVPRALEIPSSASLHASNEALRKAQEQLEARVRERTADLSVAVQARDDFLAIAGHELKTPLAALLMQVQGLSRALRKDPTTNVADRLDRAAGSGLRMERLINQLLDVSRITAGRLVLEPETCDLAEVTAEVVARFADVSAKAGSPISIRGETSIVGRWDRLRIDQVVTNLIDNAVKYGRGRPVEVELSTDGGDAIVRVVDHGIGIDDDHQKKVFQRFERAVATREFGGLGLGLWITRQIVEASGGSIDLVSAPQHGSTFTVRLPVRPAEVAHGGG